MALHRAAYLARSNPESRVLLTTFSGSLANALRAKLRRLISSEPRLAELSTLWQWMRRALACTRRRLAPCA
ncbi:MAG: hypothetical protein R3F22_04715 [Lysobacteraceae bacterium]